jgi:hypothetical protein
MSKTMYFRETVILITAIFFFSSCALIDIILSNRPYPPVNSNYILLADYGLMVMRKDMAKSRWSEACGMCEQLRLGGFSDWRLPTQGELAILYNERNMIGGFETFNNTRYWSSTPYMAGGFYVCMNFTNGTMGNHLDMSNQQPLASRCVRSVPPQR